VSETAVADKVAMSGIPYEPVSDVLKRQSADGKSIEIHDLRKVFGEKAAVDGLNLSIYSGQITALLGHNGTCTPVESLTFDVLLPDPWVDGSLNVTQISNILCWRHAGAGKTTTINMLTGAMGPTEGYATVAGKDIRTDLQAIRQDIGICLQHDCLFPDLTVREHIQFFSRLKGLYKKVSKPEAEEHIDQAIRDVALFEKRNSLSKNLSGGMKRKLSVAIAFCGNSKVVLLDEPTSGMVSEEARTTMTSKMARMVNSLADSIFLLLGPFFKAFHVER
jgi:ABC-type multidrug transport system ATPase subunit